jgi:hypothetical protein
MGLQLFYHYFETKYLENKKIECLKIIFRKLNFGPHTKILPVNRLINYFVEILATLYSSEYSRSVENTKSLRSFQVK